MDFHQKHCCKTWIAYRFFRIYINLMLIIRTPDTWRQWRLRGFLCLICIYLPYEADFSNAWSGFFWCLKRYLQISGTCFSVDLKTICRHASERFSRCEIILRAAHCSLGEGCGVGLAYPCGGFIGVPPRCCRGFAVRLFFWTLCTLLFCSLSS